VISFIEEEKAALLHDRAGGLIELCRPETSLDHVGGIGVLKDWLIKRGGFVDGNIHNKRHQRLPTPKGVLLTGPPGCGKSFVVSALAGSWGIHLVKLATPRLFSSLVGQTEQNLLTALEIVQSLSPCILWVEEFEKFFPGTSSTASDGGVLSRVLGMFLDFLQSDRDGVFVCATTNSIHRLPMEIMRAGRFDAVFLIDLPNREERKTIFEALFKRYGIDEQIDATNTLLNMTDGFSGAEMEQAIIEALYDGLETGPNQIGLMRAVKGIVPLAATMREKISKMREWCLWRTRLASYPEQPSRKEKGKTCRISQR
jgi:SpoVK/Ycf46/Vps4 family AAA+-type ATPase